MPSRFYTDEDEHPPLFLLTLRRLYRRVNLILPC